MLPNDYHLFSFSYEYSLGNTSLWNSDCGCLYKANANANKRALTTSKIDPMPLPYRLLYKFMESAGLRRRKLDSNGGFIMDNGGDANKNGDEPPRYTIDLSLPPRKRYQHVATELKPQIAKLPTLFDEIVQDLRMKVSVETVRWLARLLLRRVYSNEETEELRGIQEIVGYLSVS